MIYYTAFHPNHINRLDVQDAQAEEALLAVSQPERTAMAEGYAFTAWQGSTCLGMAGIADIWPGRAVAWALLSMHAGRVLPVLTKRARRSIAEHPAKRIEATVLCGFEPGARWVRALGFTRETPRMESYDPLGRDMSMWVRIKR